MPKRTDCDRGAKKQPNNLQESDTAYVKKADNNIL